MNRSLAVGIFELKTKNSHAIVIKLLATPTTPINNSMTLRNISQQIFNLIKIFTSLLLHFNKALRRRRRRQRERTKIYETPNITVIRFRSIVACHRLYFYAYKYIYYVLLYIYVGVRR